MLIKSCDFLVIGAGPAGMAAAATSARLGVSTLLVDEQSALGGQIYRAAERHDGCIQSVSQADWKKGLSLVSELRGSGAAYQPGSQVWQLEKDCRVYVTDGSVARCIAARRVLIATGAVERAVPIPGWTLPGVMTVGAAQILYKTSRWIPAGDTWIAGSGPLIWLYAVQVLEAGGGLAGIIDTTPAGNYFRTLPHAFSALRNHSYLRRGLSLKRRVRDAGVRVVRSVSGLQANGEGRLAAVRYFTDGKWREVPASILLLHQGVVPNIHASLSIGVRHHWDRVQRCFKPMVDQWANTDIDGYAVAGDCAGIVGSEASAIHGRLAALEAARALGFISEEQCDRDARPLREELDRHMPVRPFLDQLFAPRLTLLAPADDVLVCRCESVSARQIRDAVALGCLGPNQMKAYTRCGMGPCQGRMCGLAAAEIIAKARGTDPDEIGLFNVRPPLKPLSLKELSELVQSQ